MEKMNIQKHVNMLLCMLVWMLMYSCSGEDTISPIDGIEEEATLSVLLNASQEDKTKSAGNPDINAESKIYSLEIIVFKSEGEAGAGKLDGYGYVIRNTRNVTGQTYDKEFIEVNEIQNIKVTAGKRDIYVVANAPDKYFSSVTTIQEFLSKYENLFTQGRYPHPGNTTSDPNEELPIGGINPSDLKTNLTMCNYMKSVSFNNEQQYHYLGYTDNNGRPSGVDPSKGTALNGIEPFYVERLVARVAINKIDFSFPAEGLSFESGHAKVTDFTYHIDSVFMINVKTTSKFAYDSQLGFTEKFGHGCAVGYSFLSDYLSNLNQQSLQTDFLVESISTPKYDITTNATPLWFYAFENADSSNPTYMVIGVKYNFKSSKDNIAKTVKCYYPIVVNQPESGKQASHDYIKRNYQYQITAKIKGLGSLYKNNPVPLKSLPMMDQDIEITESVGLNLFPWTGDIYK